MIFILQLNINGNVYFLYMLFIIVIIINIPFLFIIPNKQRPDCAAKLQFSSFHLCFKLLCRGWTSVTFLPVSSPSVTSNEAKSRKPNIPVCVVKYTPKPIEDRGLSCFKACYCEEICCFESDKSPFWRGPDVWTYLKTWLLFWCWIKSDEYSC